MSVALTTDRLMLRRFAPHDMAARAARDPALNHLRLPSLVSHVAPENRRSAAVAARIGAVRDGALDGWDICRHPASEGT